MFSNFFFHTVCHKVCYIEVSVVVCTITFKYCK